MSELEPIASRLTVVSNEAALLTIAGAVELEQAFAPSARIEAWGVHEVPPVAPAVSASDKSPQERLTGEVASQRSRRPYRDTRLLLLPQQTSPIMMANSLSLADGEPKVIRFSARGAAHHRESGLRRWDTKGQSNVIPYRLRGAASRRELAQRILGLPGESTVLGMCECAPENDNDYRHRMLVNILATGVLIVLMTTGYWAVNMMVKSPPDSETYQALPRTTSNDGETP
jgi:hypothetical protein